MTTYIIRRLLLMFPTLLGITMVVFGIMALAPGQIGGNMMDDMGNVESEALREIQLYYEQRYGLNDPIPVQYVRWLNQVSPIGYNTDAETGERYWDWLKAPDLGRAFSKGRPVMELYGEALPITITLNLITIPIIYFVAIFTGVYAARFRGRTFDVASGTSFLALWSLPVMWVAVVLIYFFANREMFYIFPTSGLSSIEAAGMTFLPSWNEDGFVTGWLLDRMWHLVLPVLCLTYGGFAVLSKLTRGSVLENISADFARTARAKGVGDRDVLWRHVFRNSLLPLITVAASLIPSLLAGSVIVEQIFSIPGMGKLMVEAVFARDRELILAGALIGGLIGLTCRIIADVCYAIADPRVSYE